MRALGLGAALMSLGCSSEAALFAGTGGGGAGGSSGVDAGGGGSVGVAQGGSGGMLPCQPGDSNECYTGPRGTQGVGICVAGMQSCNAQGTGFGPCAGEVTPAAEVCGNAVDEDCNGADVSCNPGAPIWAKAFGDPTTHTMGTSNVALATDAVDNVILGVTMNGLVADFGGGALSGSNSLADVALVKLDAQGNHQWSHRFGSDWDDWLADVAVGPSNVVWMTGNAGGPIDFGGGASSNLMFVAKFDSAGSHLWSNTFGTWPAQGRAIAVTSGGVIVAGFFADTISFGGPTLTTAGVDDIFVAKLDAQGNHVWSLRFGDEDKQTVQHAAVDTAGNIYVAGDYWGNPDFGGGPLPNVTSGTGAYLVKLTASGTHVWSKAFGGGNNSITIFNVATDPSGNVWFGGGLLGSWNFGGGTLTTSPNGYDPLLVEFNSAGSHLASNRWGDAPSDQIWSLAIDTNGDAAFGGDITGTVDFGGGPLTTTGNADAFVAKLTASHTHVFSHSAGSAMGYDVCYAVTSDSANNTIAAGRFNGTINFGTSQLTASGPGGDLFVVKFQP